MKFLGTSVLATIPPQLSYILSLLDGYIPLSTKIPIVPYGNPPNLFLRWLSCQPILLDTLRNSCNAKLYQ
jgi:hypothetical protein